MTPTLKADPAIQYETHGGQLVCLRQVALAPWRLPSPITNPIVWYIVPPTDGFDVGPFVSRELALAVAADYFSHGVAF